MSAKKFFVLAFLILHFCQTSNAVEDDRPDVLFIAVDDLNDWVGHLGGHPQAKTPHIDRLVSKGLVFTNAHCAAPACNPSRAALMSGIRPWKSGIYLNANPAAGVMKKTVTINRHFLDCGYNVFGGGKIYHGYSSEGRKDTWTEWATGFSTPIKGAQNFNGLNKKHFDWGAIPVKTAEMRDAKLTNWAIDKIKNGPNDKPMFLAVGYVKPHLPWYAPKEYFDRFPLDEIQLPTTKKDDLKDIPAAGIKMAKPGGDHADVVKAGEWKKAVQGYLATVSFLDDQVGRLLKALDESPRSRKTIVVWWTDHGWHLGEKQHWRKFALWNDATRTSFAISAPGITSANTVCDAPVDYMSIFPTLCELTETEKPKHVKGPSLLPLLKAPDAEWEHVAICSHGKGNHAAISRDYRFIQYRDGGSELYHRKRDPNEWKNLISDSPAIAKIAKRLAQHLPDPGSELPPTGVVKKNKDSKSKKNNKKNGN